MEDELVDQYDEFASEFAQGTEIYNIPSRAAFYAMFDFDLKGKRILDVGCGDGYDLKEFSKRGAIVFGLDASQKLLQMATRNVPSADFQLGTMESLPYADNYFDIVVSKYALQSSSELQRVLSEMYRVVKPGGIVAYLTVHPLRQFLEKKKHPKDYYTQEVVESHFFGGTVTALEPTHTLEEYLNPEFLRDFQITYFREHTDFPSAERIEGDTYPCFFVMRATKR